MTDYTTKTSLRSRASTAEKSVLDIVPGDVISTTMWPLLSGRWMTVSSIDFEVPAGRCVTVRLRFEELPGDLTCDIDANFIVKKKETTQMTKEETTQMTKDTTSLATKPPDTGFDDLLSSVQDAAVSGAKEGAAGGMARALTALALRKAVKLGLPRHLADSPLVKALASLAAPALALLILLLLGDRIGTLKAAKIRAACLMAIKHGVARHSESLTEVGMEWLSEIIDMVTDNKPDSSSSKLDD